LRVVAGATSRDLVGMINSLGFIPRKNACQPNI